MKKYFFTILSLLLLTPPAFADSTIGFHTGNEFISRLIRGRVTVRCRVPGGGFETTYHLCQAEILDPSEWAYFQGHKGIDAEEVYLTATHEDGSTREKNESFDPATGLSKGKFNLWIATLFQRPLLNLGKNAIHYSLKKDKQNILEGDLIAEVKRAETRTCSDGSYFSSNPSDCRSPDNNVCGYYFRDKNYCE